MIEAVGRIPLEFKADIIGRTKDGKKFVEQIWDFSKAIRKWEREKKEVTVLDKKRRFKDVLYTDQISDVWRHMELLRDVMKTEKDLKDVKIFRITIPKKQTEFRFSDGRTLLQKIKDYVERKMTCTWEDDATIRKKTKEEMYPFKVEVKVV